MSTIFCLLISISSLHGPFISSGRPLKGLSGLPPLISSQPHRSQAFPTQRFLYSHKDPRNPAACPQLIFPVAILLTQPPTGRGCKWRAGNRPLCVPNTTPIHLRHCCHRCHCCLARPAVDWPECQSPGGSNPPPTISIKGFFHTGLSPPFHPSNRATPPSPAHSGSFFSPCVCFYLSNLSFTLIRRHKYLKLLF